MKSSEFVNQLKEIAPSKSLLKERGFDKGFIKIYLKSYNLKKRHDETVTVDPLLDLIYRYDVGGFDIGMVHLEKSKNVLDVERYIVFGSYDADILVIDKVTDEVVVLDWDDESHVLMKCSKNSDTFLQALLEVATFNKNMLLDEDLSSNQEIIKSKASEISKIAGGDNYLGFYLNILGYEG